MKTKTKREAEKSSDITSPKLGIPTKAKKKKRTLDLANGDAASIPVPNETSAVSNQKKRMSEHLGEKTDERALKKRKRAEVGVSKEEPQMEEVAEPKRKKQKRASQEASAMSPTAEDDARSLPSKASKKKFAKRPDLAAANSGKEGSLTVFVGGFPFDVGQEALQTHFEKCGKVTKLVVPKDHEGKRRGIAYVTFQDRDSVDAACKLDRSDFGGRTLMVNRVRLPSKSKGKGNRNIPAPTSFDHEVSIRGLPFSITADQLRRDFEECGEIVNFKLLYNEEGKVRGTAFIAYKTATGLRNALAYNETEYAGRTIYICRSGDFGPKAKGGKSGKGKEKSDGKDKRKPERKLPWLPPV